VLRARCSRLEQQIPLNPLIDAFRARALEAYREEFAEPWRDFVIRDLPKTKPGKNSGFLDPQSVSRELFESIKDGLGTIAKDTAVLWIDDFQWVDQTTATALEFALRRWDRGTLVLIVTARPTSSGETGACAEFVKSSQPLLKTMEVGQLGTSDVITIATSILGRSLSAEHAARFLALTDGVPLFVVEAAHELWQGRLPILHGEEGSLTPSIPIQQIVDERLALLAPEVRRILDLIVVSERIPLTVLKELVPSEDTSLIDALDKLVRLRLVSDEEHNLRCKHELIRHGIYARLGHLKRSQLHGQIAGVMSRDRGNQDPAQIALHFHHAGRRAEAFAFASVVAARAEEVGAFHEATRFLRIARLNTDDNGEAATLLGREASIRYHEADFDQALPLLTMAEQQFRELGDIEAAATWAVRRLHATSEAGASHPGDSIRSLDGVLQECAANGFWELYLEAVECRLRILERDNRVDEFRSTIDRVEEVPREGDPRIECLVNSVKGLRIVFGNGVGALSAAQRSYELAEMLGQRDLQDRALHRLVFVNVLGGTLNTTNARALLDSRLSRATRGDSFKTRYGFLEAAALWHLEMGAYSAAEEFFLQAERVISSAPDMTEKVHMYANRAEQLALAGQLSHARDYYERARDALRPHHYWRAHQAVHGGLGYCALELGDLRMARDCEARLEYQNEHYFDASMIILFRATLLRRRGELEGAANYLAQVVRPFEGRLRTVVLKCRFLECRIRQRFDRKGASELAEWLVEESSTLKLDLRLDQARRLLTSLRAV
jgi:tetratricopeptide (TPR) repeat protein